MRNLATSLPSTRPQRDDEQRGDEPDNGRRQEGREEVEVVALLAALLVAADLGDLYAESGQTLQGSFSSISKPNFASKYSFESSRRDLHNALLSTALILFKAC